MSTATQLAAGLAGAIGSDFRASQNQLIFVEYGGKLSALSLFSTAAVVSSGSTLLKGTWLFDLDMGVQSGISANADIFWEQQTAVIRRMVPQNSAKIINLGVVDFAGITANNLQYLPYSTSPIMGNNDPTNRLVPGDVFAVLTNKGNYAKVKVVAYGYDLQIQWVTYKLNPAYSVLGTGYSNPEDVKISRDNNHLYITERASGALNGTLVRVAFGAANRAAATVIASGMTAPQQLMLDEDHNAAYVVEYATSGHVYRVDLTTGTKTAVLSNLNFPVGLALSADLQYAFISEQTTGSDKGRVSRFRLSDGVRQPLVTGLTAPFFLTWTDTTRTFLLVPERDPANRITAIDVSHATSSVVATGLPFRPSSVTEPNPGRMLICSDTVIESLDFIAAQPTGPLLMGIGFIPFDKITGAGLADTTVDPGYFYQVKNTPFGGTLPIMVNFQRAANDNTVYYRVKVDGLPRTDTWTDYKWNGTQYVAQSISPETINNQPGYYPVRPISDLFLWMNPSLGSLMDSTNLTNVLHTILIEFTDVNGNVMESATPITIRVDNNHCTATLSAPTLNGSPADPACGYLKYVPASKAIDKVTLAFTASHPNNFANYSFTLVKGANVLTPPSVSGLPVSPLPTPVVKTVSDLLGTCVVAGLSEYLYVAATTNNGWGRQSQYDASAAFAFALAS